MIQIWKSLNYGFFKSIINGLRHLCWNISTYLKSNKCNARTTEGNIFSARFQIGIIIQWLTLWWGLTIKISRRFQIKCFNCSNSSTKSFPGIFVRCNKKTAWLSSPVLQITPCLVHNVNIDCPFLIDQNHSYEHFYSEIVGKFPMTASYGFKYLLDKKIT